MQLVHLFLVSFLFIEINPNNNIENIVWIKNNVYNSGYYILDIFRSSLIIKIIKLIINEEVSTTTIQKNKKILLEIVDKIQKETFWPAITKFLCIYIMFAIDSPNFS